jgi:hypothetical protein
MPQLDFEALAKTAAAEHTVTDYARCWPWSHRWTLWMTCNRASDASTSKGQQRRCVLCGKYQLVRFW